MLSLFNMQCTKSEFHVFLVDGQEVHRVGNRGLTKQKNGQLDKIIKWTTSCFSGVSTLFVKNLWVVSFIYLGSWTYNVTCIYHYNNFSEMCVSFFNYIWPFQNSIHSFLVAGIFLKLNKFFELLLLIFDKNFNLNLLFCIINPN